MEFQKYAEVPKQAARGHDGRVPGQEEQVAAARTATGTLAGRARSAVRDDAVPDVGAAVRRRAAGRQGFAPLPSGAARPSGPPRSPSFRSRWSSAISTRTCSPRVWARGGTSGSTSRCWRPPWPVSAGARRRLGAAARAPGALAVRAPGADVGPPFVLLAATAPLLQSWFAATGHRGARDPYFLYAASNAGSMVALWLTRWRSNPSWGWPASGTSGTRGGRWRSASSGPARVVASASRGERGTAVPAAPPAARSGPPGWPEARPLAGPGGGPLEPAAFGHHVRDHRYPRAAAPLGDPAGPLSGDVHRWPSAGVSCSRPGGCSGCSRCCWCRWRPRCS